ncbi:phosphate ABC transporter permease PstA [Magnetofaba australis]|uniref:Phosphate transport system permease protein PstA n=1 Tax=Magnetofaba australis IT-1 TaxID=1434232 RepID=A0A1Y2K4U3_9PROT|nr:phosphate ABC transporter permease PstA [Magnetofaba australis]OSM04387.1 putative phosphate ABC transporter permease [Magnetofaba australis IT-1]
MSTNVGNPFTSKSALALLKKRNNADRNFRLMGLSGIALAAIALAILLVTMAGNGFSALWQSQIQLQVNLDPEVIYEQGKTPEEMRQADYLRLVKYALRDAFPKVKSRRDKKDLYRLVSPIVQFDLAHYVAKNPDQIGQTVTLWMLASDDVDMKLKGLVDGNGGLSDKQAAWVEELLSQGKLEKQFNARFFTDGPSRDPEAAGIYGAIVGSFLTMVICFLVSFPIGLLTAVYLEEFSKRNRLSDFIEININNLAAVPSIVFGLLGLVLFINLMHIPRSAPLVGGLTMALMTLPTIIIATRAALNAVPPSIREAARGVGASSLQVVVHHVVPLAMPGILTGTIIGMARALGETAPLLMIGMVAFVMDIPGSFTDAATVLPVQIYLWADMPERAFMEKTAAATLVLLGFLVVMNAIAVVMRKRFERRW